MNVSPESLPVFAAPCFGMASVPAMESVPRVHPPQSVRAGGRDQSPPSPCTGEGFHQPFCGGRVNPLAHAGWDALLAGWPQATFFHTAAWARVLQDTYGHQPHYFCRLARGAIAELLPLMEVSSPFTGRRGVALPFTDFCPLLASEPDSASDLFAAALEFGRARRWKYFEFRGGVPAGTGASPSLAHHAHILDLSADERALLAGLEPATRRGIKKARAAGLQVRFSQGLEAMRTFFTLHCQTRRKHGLPPQPFRFFANITRHVLEPGHGHVVTAELDGRAVAAAVFFHFGSQAIYKFGASASNAQHLRPNNLLMWEAIRRYAARGFRTLHFGRTSLGQDGLRRFKLGFGASEERLEYCRYDFSRSAFVTDAPRVGSWFDSVSRALPGPLLRLAGAALYPHLS